VYYNGYILMLIVVIYSSISYNRVGIYILKAVFSFYISGESITVSQFTVIIVMANRLVERIYTKLHLVFT